MTKRRFSSEPARSRESFPLSRLKKRKRRRSSSQLAMSSSEVEEVPLTPRRARRVIPPLRRVSESTKNRESKGDASSSEVEEVPVTRHVTERLGSSRDRKRMPVSPEVQEVPLTKAQIAKGVSRDSAAAHFSEVEEVPDTRFVVEKPPANASLRNVTPSIPPKRVHGVDLKAAQQITRRVLLVDDAVPTYYYMPDLDIVCSPLMKRFLYRDGFNALHPAIDPASRGENERGNRYGVPPKRAARKREQIANLVAAVAVLESLHTIHRRKHAHTNNKGKILDMCGGCGHVGLTLAALFPNWDVIVVDTRPFALDVANRRAREAGLNNLSTLQRNIENLGELKFDIAVALHACGGASDTVLAKAAECSASVVVASCCTGGIVSTKGSVTGSASGAEVVDPASPDRTFIDWDCPRSSLFRSVLGTGEYSRLARAADFGEKLDDKDDWRRVAKSLLEHDRALWMTEANYHVRILKMKPLSCTPKNDMLMAWPRSNEPLQNDEEQIQWDVDKESEKYLQDVRDGNVLKGLGATEVAEIEKVLNAEVCAESSNGTHTFPKGIGKRKRKVIHAVADSMGLWHESAGKGIERCVTVRRTGYWPLFFDRYVGVGGPALERLCHSFLSKIPPQCASRRALLRGNSHHVTIIRPQEISWLPPHFKTDRDALLFSALDHLKNSTMKICGIGRVSEESGGHLGKDLGSAGDQSGGRGRPAVGDGDGTNCLNDYQCNEAYFVVVFWPEANAFRRELGLPDADFHITLGFTVKDIHDVRKDHSTIVFQHDKRLSLW